MRASLKSPVRPSRVATPSRVTVRFVETSTGKASRIRHERRKRERESRIMALVFGVVAFGMTLTGLYVNEHAALNGRVKFASRIETDNVRLQEQIATIDSEADRLKLTMTAPSAGKISEMKLIADSSPRYLSPRSRKQER